MGCLLSLISGLLTRCGMAAPHSANRNILGTTLNDWKRKGRVTYELSSFYEVNIRFLLKVHVPLRNQKGDKALTDTAEPEAEVFTAPP